MLASWQSALRQIALSASAAMAADPIFIPPPPAPPPMAPAPVAHNWGGFHAGALIIRELGGPPAFLIAAQAGFNIQRNNLVFGFDTRFGRLPGAGPLWIGAGGKAGLALGARGNILVYGTGALIYLPGPADLFYAFGGGGEFGIGDRLSIFAELLALGEPGPGGGCCIPGLAAGVNFRFGN